MVPFFGPSFFSCLGSSNPETTKALKAQGAEFFLEKSTPSLHFVNGPSLLYPEIKFVLIIHQLIQEEMEHSLR